MGNTIMERRMRLLLVVSIGALVVFWLMFQMMLASRNLQQPSTSKVSVPSEAQ